MSHNDGLFRHMLENSPQREQAEVPVASREFDTESRVRNLCFVWPDGRKLFLNYSYLICAEYLPDAMTIRLSFTTHSIVLKGIFLESLFDELMRHIPKIISATDLRYNATVDDKKTIVNEIVLES